MSIIRPFSFSAASSLAGSSIGIDRISFRRFSPHAAVGEAHSN